MDHDAQTLLIKELFLAAKPLHGEERSRYLADHCPDAVLRVEVERLLNADDSTVTALAASHVKHDKALAQGAVLGHYRIVRKLGEGGMGSVYEAIDEKLHRTAALKVLKSGGHGEDMSRRLYREAESASALNHPNIVTIYEIGHENDIEYIAMEKIAGKTLRHEIGPKGMPLSSALRYAVQIADALAAAHHVQIVHRDLKPGNVMVTERGLVKVLDFGLAKSIAKIADGDGEDITLTQPGQVVGTLQYMSPEQAEGKAVDARSDIFAFGSLLFEMLTGQRAFQGTGVGLLISIVQQEPALDLLPASVPKTVARIIGKCLQKRPSDRWQHIADVKLQLDDILKDLESPPDSTIGAQPVRHRRPFGWPGVAAGCVAGALAVIGVALVMKKGPTDGAATKRVLHMVTADQGLNSFPALSKDGKLVAFSSDRSGEGHLDIWLQQIGGRDPLRLTKDPADETDPTFSPDGIRVAFRSEAKGGGIYVVPAIGGGEPVLLAPGGRNPRFSPDGKWVAYWTGRDGSFVAGAARTFIVEAGGGQPRQIHPEMASAMRPSWSPRGDELMVLGRKAGVGFATFDWWSLPLADGSPHAAGAVPRLLADGLLQSQRGMGVFPNVLDWTGNPSERILFAAVVGDSANLWEFDINPNGQVYGSAHPVTTGPGRQVQAVRATTPEAERIAFSDELLNFDVWTLDIDADTGLARGEPKRLTTGASPEWSPSMTWDGTKISYISRHARTWSLRLLDQGSGIERGLLFSAGVLLDAKLAGDGSRIYYSNLEGNLFSVPSSGGPSEKLCDKCGTITGASTEGARLVYEPLQDEDVIMFDTVERQSRRLALRPKSDSVLSGTRWSRDGGWIAFHALDNQRGTGQLWIAPVSQGRTVPQTSWIAITDGTALEKDPAWAPSGRLIYFISERDGFACVWARRLDLASKRPTGEAFPVRHFHSARQSLRRAGAAHHLTGLAIGGTRMVFALSELTGNIWLAETLRPN